MADDWVVREDPGSEVSLATKPVRVRQYERISEKGRPEVVHGYQAMRSWWIPHPDWLKGQQEWVTAGEKAWEARGAAARAKEEAADKAADAAGQGSGGRAGSDTTAGAERAERGSGARTSSQRGGTQVRPEHGYARPDPARLVRERGTYKKPDEHPFFKKNPLSADNVVKSYDESTPSERYQGMRWYEDAHRLAWALGGGDAAKGAAMLAAFSPQTGWPVNIFNAARMLADGKIDGKVMATGDMMKSAQRILDGEHPNDVLKSPKTNAFGMLIAQGRDHPEDELGRVVVDRHAMSVAAGRRLMKEDVNGKGENRSPIGDEYYYEHVADMYRQAARVISEREGEEISPHQLQAITWLRQQRANGLDDASRPGGTGKGQATGMRNAWATWQKYANEHGLRTELGTTALPPTPITADEVAREADSPGASRPVSAAEFYDTANQGKAILQKMADSTSPADGLTSNWEDLADQAWQAVQQSWGGVTIDAHTGALVPDGADKFAVTVKPPGIGTISIPEGGTEAQFDKAMDEALKRFGPLLEQDKYHLGIFHDDENHRIDIDPVVVLDTQGEAEAVGAYTHNIGGSYRFSDGNGYFPPHIKGET